MAKGEGETAAPKGAKDASNSPNEGKSVVKKEESSTAAATTTVPAVEKTTKSEDKKAATAVGSTNSQASSSAMTAPQPIQPQTSQNPKEPDQYENYPLKNIRTPHAHDVLCGRGGGTNNHAGNESFRDLVNERKRVYLNSSKREKPLVSRSIVEAVRARRPPGRFLTKDEKTGLWNDIGDQKAREKTSQALREGAPVIRREIGMNAAAAAASATNRALASQQPPPGPSNRLSGGAASSPHHHLAVAGGASWGSSPHHSLQTAKAEHAHHHVTHHPHAHLLPHHPPPNGVVGASSSSPLTVPPRTSPLKNQPVHSSRAPSLGAATLGVSELSALQPPPSASPHALSSSQPTAIPGAADTSPMSSAVPESVRHLLRKADQNGGQQQLSAQMQVQLERQRAVQHEVEAQRAQQMQHQGYTQSQIMASTQMPYQHHQTVAMPSQYGGMPLHHAIPGGGAGSVIAATPPGTDGLRRHAPPIQQHLQQQQYLGGVGRGGASSATAQSLHTPYNVGPHGANLVVHENPSWTNSASLPTNAAVAPEESETQPKQKESQQTNTQPPSSSASSNVDPTDQKHLSSLPEDVQDKIRLLECEAKSIAGKTATASDWASANVKSGIFMDAGLLGVDLDDVEAALSKSGNGGSLGSLEMEKALKGCCRSGKGSKNNVTHKHILAGVEKDDTDSLSAKRRKLNEETSECNDNSNVNSSQKVESTVADDENLPDKSNEKETTEEISKKDQCDAKEDGKANGEKLSHSSGDKSKSGNADGEAIEKLDLFGHQRKATETCRKIVSVLKTIDAVCT